MTDPTRGAAQGDPGRHGEPGPPQTPRWVKISGLIALVIAVLVLLLWVLGGPGDHGPERHGQMTPASGVSLYQEHS